MNNHTPNSGDAYPIAWEEEKKRYLDYNLGENIAILQLIHHERFNPAWIEYHHPRLTRVFYNAVKSIPRVRTQKSGHMVSELQTMMFSWIT